MNFKITPLFTQKDIQKDIEKRIQVLHDLVVNELYNVGLQWATNARAKAPLEGWHRDASSIVTATKLAGAYLDLSGSGSFNDQTGNLRNSIGFIVLYDGQVAKSNFQKTAEKGADGMEIGKAFANQIAADYPLGYALILVAGMEYASFVEGKGFDVITGSTLNANADMGVAFRNVKKALQK